MQTPVLTRADLNHNITEAKAAGCLDDQIERLLGMGVVLQPRQLAACAAARACDIPDGPTAVGYGGARGGGKTHWLLAQIGVDDCQRIPGIKCLILRKVGKSNLENFDALRRRLYAYLPHDFNISRGQLTFANGSQIVLGHYQCEKDIDAYLGLEYDVIGIEEATQLTARKYEDISTCCRTSRPGWRPRIYSTTNPGGVGHQWYYEKFILPHQCRTETTTRFIHARVEDNKFINPEYVENLARRSGWQRDAWYLGRWDFAAGQFFRYFHPDYHVADDPPAPTPAPPRNAPPPSVPPPPPAPRPPICRTGDAQRWFAAMDYGYTHRTVVLLAFRDYNDNIWVVDEHAERGWIPQQHAVAIKAMFARHRVYCSAESMREILLADEATPYPERESLWRRRTSRMLSSFVVGSDAFGAESIGGSVAHQYRQFGLTLRPANMDRTGGWSALLNRFGNPAAGVAPTLFIHKRCKRLIECLPTLQHDPDRPGDILKSNINDEGLGGDDAADALRYLVATTVPVLLVRKLRGL